MIPGQAELARQIAIVAVTAFAVLTAAGGCAASGAVSAERGLIMATTGTRELALPTGVERAVIYEIDGVRVPAGQQTVQLFPGSHEIRAAPFIPGPTHQVPTAEWLATRLRNRTVTVDITPGSRYMIGIRWLEPLNYQRAGGAYEAVAFRPGALSEQVRSQEPP